MSRRGAGEISTRELILRESSRLFAEHGFHGTSTRDIAEAVGIRQPSLFHHFSAKRDIMTELQQHEFTASLELLTLAIALETGAAARLYFALYLEVRRLLGSPFVFTGTTAAAVLNDPSFAEARAGYDRAQTAQTSLIALGVAAGDLIDIDPAFANRAVDWTIEGVLVDASRDPNIDADQLAELLASFTVRSLLLDTDRLDDVRAEAMQKVAEYDRSKSSSGSRPAG